MHARARVRARECVRARARVCLCMRGCACVCVVACRVSRAHARARRRRRRRRPGAGPRARTHAQDAQAHVSLLEHVHVEGDGVPELALGRRRGELVAVVQVEHVVATLQPRPARACDLMSVRCAPQHTDTDTHARTHARTQTHTHTCRRMARPRGDPAASPVWRTDNMHAHRRARSSGRGTFARMFPLRSHTINERRWRNHAHAGNQRMRGREAA